MKRLVGAIALLCLVLVACSSPRGSLGVQTGGLCNSGDIVGVAEASFSGKLPGCGIENPVRVYEVAGVKLSQPALMTCGNARALATWVKGSVKPAFQKIGGGVESLQVAAHYACRTRNSKPGAKLSEHANGDAIDISGFNLKDGQQIRVLSGWKDRDIGAVLKGLHRKACGPFGTVLGPNSDRFHQDHIHLDTARYRNGTYCR